MRPTYLLMLLTCFVAGKAKAQDSTQILFIGNSFTYYYDMPESVEKMLNESNLKVKVSQITRPGATLVSHLTSYYNAGVGYHTKNPDSIQTIAKVLSQRWDYVVIQEPPPAILVAETRQYGYYPAVRKFDSLTRSKGGKTLLYQPFALSKYPAKFCMPAAKNTAPSKYGSKQQVGRILFNTFLLEKYPDSLEIQEEYCSDSFKSAREEFKAIEHYTNEIATKTNAGVARVGEAILKFNETHPEITIINTFDNHPTEAGSFLIACIFYQFFSGKSAADLKYAADLKPDIASVIKQFAGTLR